MSATADREQVETTLRGADIVVLAMVLVQWTGEEALLDELRPFVKGPWDYLAEVPAELADRIRGDLAERIIAYRSGSIAPPPAPPLALVRKMMDVAVGQFVPDEYVPMLLDDISLQTADPSKVVHRQPDSAALAAMTATIIGGGMSGIVAAIKLREAGVACTLFEKSDSVGGVWYQNTYPGCGVDTPNHFYTYSFLRNDDWSHYFSKRDELYRYFVDTADRYGIRDIIRFRSEVIRAEYEEDRQIWRTHVRQDDGTVEIHESNIVIFAVGALNRPAIPDIPGMEGFTGEWCHTAEWKEDMILSGRHVALIGTGASGVQVGPAIAPEVERLAIFQRSPQWLSPNPNYHRPVTAGKKWALKHVPGYASWYRFQLFWGSADGNHPALQVDPDWKTPDISINALNEVMRENLTRHILAEIEGRPDLVKKVIPTYPPYGKRMLRDNRWYQMLMRDNVDLVTARISHIDADHIVTEEGERFRADAIIFATGFRASEMLAPITVTGRKGRDLRTQWDGDDPRAHLGITVPGFPNLFILFGPNTVLAHGGSAIFQSECQVHYIVRSLQRMAEGNYRALEVKQEAHDRYNERVDRQHSGMVWAHPGVSSWYKNRKGRVTVAQPWRMIDYWNWTRDIDPQEYHWYR